jgi:hypothetical protein
MYRYKYGQYFQVSTLLHFNSYAFLKYVTLHAVLWEKFITGFTISHLWVIVAYYLILTLFPLQLLLRLHLHNP